MRNLLLFSSVLAAAAFVPAVVPTAARAPLCAPARCAASPTAKASITGLRSRLISLPATAARGLWQRCTPDWCAVGRPRPLEMLNALIPRRRPLALLINKECSEGIYKVERRPQQGRHLVLFPFPKKAECSVDDAMDMF